MNSPVNTLPEPTTTDRGIGPALSATLPPEYTDDQLEAASRPPSLESIFAAHLKLLELQDTEWLAGR